MEGIRWEDDFKHGLQAGVGERVFRILEGGDIRTNQAVKQ